MRNKSPALVISFTNVTEALAVEKFCQEQGLPGRIIPVPREITAGCGLAWKAAPEQRESLLEAFSRNGLLYSGDYIVNI
ncbi:MAG: DUF3343 domain-containing protein [Oscillospiraceae bacterium]|jgi:hypothetical protein|nr:DUF3343 domain-containing protein [Oscillospiraceae bacterium]